ncbi:MAG: cytochrome b N-terminal domain-containing protein [Planctomycetia bacterium]|nr:cytochrome b N-terminal domain-containing protein [Planctomycetia bacterium]
MQGLLRWLDDRTGCQAFLREALYEHVPGGSRWRYVWGSTLVFAFVVQTITGLILWAAYSPSSNSAWESVYYIQNEMQGGFWLRGIHHFMAQAMVVLLALHLVQVVWDGAYKAPREVNLWLGLILMQIVLGLSLTGYLLPWDQKGYWATRVATNLMGLVPFVGKSLQDVVVGGKEYGHHTVTRFFALHAGILPALLVFFLVMHIAVFRRHGICAKQPIKRPDQTFWPDQVLKDGVACLAVLAVVLGLNWYFNGADLGAPADGAREYFARPEWYFLYLFQFLKLFEGMGETGELLGAIVIPGAVMGFLFLMPFVGRVRVGHYFNVAFLICVLFGVGVLTFLARWEDQHNVAYQNAVWEGEQNAKLAKKLATYGIPPEGMKLALRNNARALALRTLTETCLRCHTYVDENGHGWNLVETPPEKVGDRPSGGPSAPNLYNFGRRAWVEGLLNKEKIAGDHYFGRTPIKNRDGGMVKYITGTPEDPGFSATYKPEDIPKIAAALAAEGGFQTEDKEPIAAGRALLQNSSGCAMCHEFHGDGSLIGTAPNLTGWGSREWIAGMISNPSHQNYYGHLSANEQTMPAFSASARSANKVPLHPEVIKALAEWLRGEW